MTMHSIKSFGITSFAVIIVLFSACAPGRAETDKIREPEIVISSPDLIPNPEKKINISGDMDVQKQIALLVEEIEKLKAAAARVTIIITVDLQMGNPVERDGVEITLSGGKLGKPLSCATNQIGQCIFVTDPLSDKDPDYKIKINKKRYKTTEKNLRLKPGAIITLSIRVKMLPEELKKRLNPAIPTK